MKKKISDMQLHIKCRFHILSIHTCTIHARYGQHTYAEATAAVESDKAETALMDTENDSIRITGRDDDSATEKILFSGVIQAVDLSREGGYSILSLKAVSHTWLMDIQKKSRSFQDVSMTYHDVAQIVARGYGASLIWNAPDRQLGHPLIQHRETDYQFLARLLSHLQEGITAGDFSAGISIHAGIRDGEDQGELLLEQYEHTLKAFCREKKYSTLPAKFKGYRIAGTAFTRIGDQFRIHGMPFYVMEADTHFTEGCLKCSALLFPGECFRTEKIPAKTLEGAVITGRILETRQEFVKVHLGIDRAQDADSAYEFPWTPATGNLLYCMPEKGTKAAVYFGSADEASGSVIYSVRENGLLCGELADPQNRYFTTDSQKRMHMEPAEMGLLSMTGSTAEISIEDGRGLGLQTAGKISLLAEGQVELKGKNVSMMAPKEATFVRKDILSPAVINLCNAFDSIGRVGSFASNAAQVTEKKRKRTAPAKAAEKYAVGDIVCDLLSSIPAGDMGSSVMEAVAAGMPVFSRTGRKNQSGKGR